jgi:hypothetical protein
VIQNLGSILRITIKSFFILGKAFDKLGLNSGPAPAPVPFAWKKAFLMLFGLLWMGCSLYGVTICFQHLPEHQSLFLPTLVVAWTLGVVFMARKERQWNRQARR